MTMCEVAEAWRHQNELAVSSDRRQILASGPLHEDAGGPRREASRLVLSEEEQRTLYGRVENMEQLRHLLYEALPGTRLSLFGAIAFLQRELDSRRPAGTE